MHAGGDNEAASGGESLSERRQCGGRERTWEPHHRVTDKQKTFLSRFVEQLEAAGTTPSSANVSSSTSELQARPGTLVMSNVPKFGVDGDHLKGFV